MKGFSLRSGKRPGCPFSLFCCWWVCPQVFHAHLLASGFKHQISSENWIHMFIWSLRHHSFIEFFFFHLEILGRRTNSLYFPWASGQICPISFHWRTFQGLSKVPILYYLKYNSLLYLDPWSCFSFPYVYYLPSPRSITIFCEASQITRVR